MEEMSTFIELKISNEYYMIICGSFYDIDEEENDEEENTYFKIFRINIAKQENPLINYITASEDKIGVNINDFKGCYNIESEKIICFIYNNNKIVVHIFNYELVREYTKELSFSNFFIIDLFKCIHIKNDIGSIIYLTIEDDNYYLNLEFLNYMGEDQFSDYLPSKQYKINYNVFDYNSNNFIKISENKICFIYQNSSFINIYLIYLYKEEEEDSKVVIREYNLNTLSLYNFNKYNKISSVIYNNYIALGLNYQIPTDNEKYYGGLIIFSYANSTDYELDLEEYIIRE
jgi:hypothetical protein